MGQNSSKKYNKCHKNLGLTVFGYRASTSVYTKHHDQVQDNVLFKPFLYGLGPLSKSSFDQGSSSSNYRTDSGFLLCEKESQLWDDLIYVDHTYYSSLNTTRQVDKNELIVGDALTFNDVAILPTMQDIDLSKRALGFISPNIGLLPMIRKLDLSFNQLKEVPEAIGHLQQLETLSLSHNQISFIPDAICYLTRLTELNFSYNKISQLTPFIGELKSLQTFNLAHNQLLEISVSIESINKLTLLDISYNPLTILPAEITQLPFLRRFRSDGCPFTNSLDQQFQLAHNPPSLLETCARFIVKNKVIVVKKEPLHQQLKSILTESLYDYLSNSKACSHCKGPYFDSYVSRGRWIERNDSWVPLEYRLCSAHWSDESDRMYAMFSTCSTPQTLIKVKPQLTVLNTTQTRFQRQRTRSLITANSNSQLQAENFSLDAPSSAVKRWKFKVRNNSSFLKNHRLCS